MLALARRFSVSPLTQWRLASPSRLAAGTAATLTLAAWAMPAYASTSAAQVPAHAQVTPAPLSGVRSIVLYQYESCPFCNVVRAYLDAARLPYVVVEVEPLLKSQLAWSAYKKVPLAVLDGVPLGDSSLIIDALDAAQPAAARLRDGSPAEAKWRDWADATLVQLLTANIYRTPGEAWATFAYLTERNFSALAALPAQAVGSVAMYALAARRRRERGWHEPRAALRAGLASWAAALNGSPFLGGARPNLADVEIFGMLRAVRSLDTWREVLGGAQSETAAAAAWYARMEATVGPSSLLHRVGEAPPAVQLQQQQQK